MARNASEKLREATGTVTRRTCRIMAKQTNKQKKTETVCVAGDNYALAVNLVRLKVKFRQKLIKQTQKQN